MVEGSEELEGPSGNALLSGCRRSLWTWSLTFHLQGGHRCLPCACADCRTLAFPAAGSAQGAKEGDSPAGRVLIPSTASCCFAFALFPLLLGPWKDPYPRSDHCFIPQSAATLCGGPAISQGESAQKAAGHCLQLNRESGWESTVGSLL